MLYALKLRSGVVVDFGISFDNEEEAEAFKR